MAKIKLKCQKCDKALKGRQLKFCSSKVCQGRKKTNSNIKGVLNNLKKEKFCRLYVVNDQLRMNGGMCYAVAKNTRN